MDKAAADERKRKTAQVETRKRPSSNPSEPAESKRIKLENETQNSSASFLAAFDFTSLPASLITSLIVANLEAFTESRLISLVDTYHQNWRLGVTTPVQPPMSTGSIAMPVPKPAAASPPIQNIPTGPRKSVYTIDNTFTPPPQPMAEAAIKDEPVDPLQMDIDEDEFEFEPEKLNEEVCSFMAGVSIDFSSVLASSCLRHPKQKAISWLPA